MFKFENITRTVAAIACTIVFSSACVLGAVGPAHTTTTPNNVAVGTLA